MQTFDAHKLIYQQIVRLPLQNYSFTRC